MTCWSAPPATYCTSLHHDGCAQTGGSEVLSPWDFWPLVEPIFSVLMLGGLQGWHRGTVGAMDCAGIPFGRGPCVSSQGGGVPCCRLEISVARLSHATQQLWTEKNRSWRLKRLSMTLLYTAIIDPVEGRRRESRRFWQSKRSGRTVEKQRQRQKAALESLHRARWLVQAVEGAADQSWWKREAQREQPKTRTDRVALSRSRPALLWETSSRLQSAKEAATCGRSGNLRHLE